MYNRRPMRLEDKVAVVTGAASGIGEATVELFAEEGARVVVLDIDERGEEVARRLRGNGATTLFIRADVSKEHEVRVAMERTESELGGLDILVNNAAAFVHKGLEASTSDWQRSLGVNVVGAALASRFASEIMKRRGGGSIVNLGSISSFIAQPRFLTYSATKAAVVNMTRCMALDLAPFGIRVNCVCPGTIQTPALDRYLRKAHKTHDEFVAENAPLHLLGRIGRPREVAYAILFLASDEASFITATPMLVDGGYLAR
jgi:NAD(P)-dependent dehydrogenase (short-subunit alcohol dehydrogenase family)